MTDPRVSKASKSLNSAERLRVREDLETNLLRVTARSSENPMELAERSVALVSIGSAMVDQIAAVTFARRATAELRERFRSHLGELAGDEAADSDEVIRAEVVSALDDIDRIFIDAIHTFCMELLRSTCKDLLAEYAKPINESGKPLGLMELVQAVETVCASELRARARRAEKLVVEVPLFLQHRGKAPV